MVLAVSPAAPATQPFVTSRLRTRHVVTATADQRRLRAVPVSAVEFDLLLADLAADGLSVGDGFLVELDPLDQDGLGGHHRLLCGAGGGWPYGRTERCRAGGQGAVDQ
jgi:hypothetical protein